MKSLFDTMLYVSWHTSGRLPEKWQRAWDECAYNGTLLINELLISEIYNQLARTVGYESAQNCIMKIKSLKGIKMFPIDEDDNLAMDAGRIRLIAKQHKLNISLVDSYLISISRKTGARIHTTDHVIRDLAGVVKCEMNYLPLAEIGE